MVVWVTRIPAIVLTLVVRGVDIPAFIQMALRIPAFIQMALRMISVPTSPLPRLVGAVWNNGLDRSVQRGSGPLMSIMCLLAVVTVSMVKSVTSVTIALSYSGLLATYVSRDTFMLIMLAGSATTFC